MYVDVFFVVVNVYFFFFFFFFGAKFDINKEVVAIRCIVPSVVVQLTIETSVASQQIQTGD